MKVRATAAASDRSNAVGSLELECTPHGLVLIYLGTGAFAEGYAPGPLTAGTRVLVPWASVQCARAEGERLFIVVDPAITPLNRLDLVNFSSGDLMDEREVSRQRLVVRVASAGLSGVGLIVAALTVERVAPGAGPLGAISIGVLTAAAVLMLGMVASSRLGRRVEGQAARNVLLGELALFLPALAVRPVAPRPAPKPLVMPSFDRLVPRTTLAIALTLSASLLGAVLTGQWILAGGTSAHRDTPPARRAEARAAATERQPTLPEPPVARPAAVPSVAGLAAGSAAPAASAAADSLGPACRCLRADSPLWTAPVPRLATLVVSRRALRERRRPRLELTIAAVNGGDKDVTELTLSVQFFERDPPPSSKAYPVATRAMYYEGPLGPGQAVKWTVEARGTEFELERPELGHLGAQGEGAAPTNLIAELLHANHRPVRMYGAMLLAYLGDPRARESALELREALREDEEPYLQRVIDASAELRVCELQVSREGSTRATVEACLFNASNEPRSELGVLLRGVEHAIDVREPTAQPPAIAFEQAWRVEGTLLPQTGARVRSTLELEREAERARVFEARADRYDLLRR